jgi:hypothetical protein
MNYVPVATEGTDRIKEAFDEKGNVTRGGAKSRSRENENVEIDNYVL